MIGMTTTAPSANKHSKASPDVEEFLDKLLSSDKFEKLADRIAEKAADKIIAIQSGSKRYGHSHKMAPDITAENDRVQNKIHAYYRQKANTINETSFSDESTATVKSKEKQSLRTDKNVTSKGKKKVNSFAVVETFSDKGAKNLSLNFKHFTTTIGNEVSKEKVKAKATAEEAHPVIVEDSKEIVTDIVDEGSALSTETREKEKVNGNSLSMNKESIQNINPQTAIPTNKHTKYTAEENSLGKSAPGSQSRSEEAAETSSSSCDSDTDNKYAKTVAKTTVMPSETTPKTKTGNIARIGDSRDSESSKIDSEYIDKTTVALEREEEDKSDQPSTEVSNEKLFDESASYDNNDLTRLRSNDKQTNKTPIGGTEKEVAEDKDPIDKIDLKHKVREQNGKLYAFAQHPDYEEYHQQVKEILRSVQDNNTMVRRSDVNLDLLDLVE